MQTKRRINVFLASPTDVTLERTIAEEVVTAVNRSIRDYLEWYIDLHKWEDTTPGFGRPQGLINQVVDECDLFIGLLWERWGQPSGKYSSGFEEEYERAMAKRKTHDHPEIWLVFKEVDPNKLKDPGEQLKKVLQFQESQIALSEVLFKTVRHSDDWKAKLQNWLFEYVLKLDAGLRRTQQHPTGVVPAFESPDTIAIESVQTGGQSGIPQQLQVLSASFSKALQENTLEFSPTPEDPLQEFDVIRLFLLSATLISHRYTSEIFGAHEVNLFFKHRAQIRPMSHEEFQLLRAVVANETDVVPGWVWFKAMTEENVQNALLELAIRDSSDAVKKRALDLLASAKIKIPKDQWAARPVDHDSWEVRKAALRYLVGLEDESALAFLEELPADGDNDFSVDARHARLQLLMRLYPGKAFSESVAKDEYLSEDELRALAVCAAAADTQTLMTGTESSWEGIRKLSLQELGRRKELSVDLATKFTTDPALGIRAVAFQSLATQGALPDFETVRKALREKESKTRAGRLLGLAGLGLSEPKPWLDADSIIVSFYGTQVTDRLIKAVDWYSVAGPLAYKALALHHFQKISADLPADLANSFTRIKKDSFERGEKQFGSEQWKQFVAKMEKYDDSTRIQFTEAALTGLAMNGEPGDAEIARSFLSQTDNRLRDPAVELIAKFGNSQDVEVLLKIAQEAYGDIKQKAAAAALRLSSDPIQVAQELTHSTSTEVVHIAFSFLFDQHSNDAQKIFLELLNSETAIGRVRALYYIHKTSPTAALEEFLSTYTTRETYFYNIVTWLDRLLYAPAPLKEMFVKQLKDQAE